MLSNAIRDKLIADSTVANQIATYAKTGGKAIFTFDGREGVIPKDSPMPAVIIQSFDAGRDMSTRGTHGREIHARVRVYTNALRTSIELLATQMWKLLNKSSLTDPKSYYTIYGVMASGPGLLESDDGFPGYLITVRAFTAVDN